MESDLFQTKHAPWQGGSEVYLNPARLHIIHPRPATMDGKERGNNIRQHKHSKQVPAPSSPPPNQARARAHTFNGARRQPHPAMRALSFSLYPSPTHLIIIIFHCALRLPLPSPLVLLAVPDRLLAGPLHAPRCSLHSAPNGPVALELAPDRARLVQGPACSIGGRADRAFRLKLVADGAFFGEDVASLGGGFA
jgi:hypothetical protein